MILLLIHVWAHSSLRAFLATLSLTRRDADLRTRGKKSSIHQISAECKSKHSLHLQAWIPSGTVEQILIKSNSPQLCTLIVRLSEQEPQLSSCIRAFEPSPGTGTNDLFLIGKPCPGTMCSSKQSPIRKKRRNLHMIEKIRRRCWRLCVCVSLECVTVLSSVQASTQPDGDAGFTLSMTVSSMQQRMRCAKQMDNICSVILKPASGFFSLFISFSLALFHPEWRANFHLFWQPGPVRGNSILFSVVFAFRISSLPPLFVFPSCLIKPSVWCSPKWLLLSKHFKARANYIYYVSIASCVHFKSTYCI